MNTVITGGAGFIGSHVVDALQADALDVIVLDNLSSGHAGNLSERTPLKVGDVRDEQTASAAVSSGVDCVFHLAAQIDVRQAVEDPVLDAQVNVCLLYTSDAADDLLCVDLGGRR